MNHPTSNRNKVSLYSSLRFVFFFCLLAISSTQAYTVADLLKPELLLHLSTQTGLSHNGVTDLLRDQRGYVWIATYDGLCRYNSNNVTVFKNGEGADVFQSNKVRSLYESFDGRIWIATDEGVSIYDYEEDVFSSLEAPTTSDTEGRLIIRKMFGDSISQRIYCCTDRHGVLVYDMNGTFVRHDHFRGYSLLNQSLSVGAHELLLATDAGLYVYDCEDGSFRLSDNRLSKATSSILLLDQHRLLVGHVEGVRKVDYACVSDSFCVEHVSEDCFTYNRASSMSLDEHGHVWLGSTFGGVVCTDMKRSGMRDVRSVAVLDKGRISTIMHQSNGVMWVGTFDRGVYCYSPNSCVFRSIGETVDKNFEMKAPEVLHYDGTTCMVKSLHQGRWCGFDAITGKEVALPADVRMNMRTMTTPVVYSQSDRMYVVSIDKSLVRKGNDHSAKWVYSDFPMDMRTSLLHSEMDTVNDCMWLGYIHDLRRVRYDADGRVESVESVHAHPYFAKRPIYQVHTVWVDQGGLTVWVGTSEDGLFQIKMKDRNTPLSEMSIKQYRHVKGDVHSLPSNFVSCIMRHFNGTLYVGTEQGGFARVDESGEELRFKTYDVRDGLSNNVVKSLTCDNSGFLWVATNVGLNRFDVYAEQFQTYRMADGLPFEDFWYHSCTLPTGELMLSGVNGLMCFDPLDLPHSEPLPNVELTTLSVLSHKGNETNRSRPIRMRGNERECVELEYDENIFVVGVDVLYEQPSSNHQLQYQLLPTSEQWITLPELTNQIPFNGLPVGEYTLMVRASTFFDEWTDAEVLQFKIHPPFYRSWWAYMLYVVFVLGVVGVAFRFTLRFKLLRRDLEVEVFKKEKLQEMNEEKHRYFSNISHELKTPLTLISAPVDSLIERVHEDKTISKQLEVIKRQANKMTQLVDLALGDRLDELNLLQRQDTTFGFHTFFDEVLSDFVFMANYEGKTLESEQNATPVFVNADKSMIEKVLNNLLSNALKYTREGDTVRASYSIEGDNLVIRIADTGYGIHAHDIPHVFERFYQGKRSVHIAGTGIGLSFARRLVEIHRGHIGVESEVERGSVFTVTLPIVTHIEVEDVVSEVHEVAGLSQRTELNEQVIDDMDIEHYIVEKKISNSLVYVVEDNVMMREFLSDTLSRYYHVRTFGNGAECLDAMQDSWPGLIVSDVMMPEVSGYELCKAVKTNVSTSHIPIILLTACGEMDERLVGLEAGADAYIPKPFHTKHLLKQVEMLLVGRILLSERYQIGIPLSMGDNQGNRAKDNEFLENLLASFAANVSNEEMDIDQLCQDLFVSRSTLYLKVKALTNSTPSQLFKNYKLKRAADMLLQNEKSVKEVCFELGFKSRSTFGRLFSEKYGVAPSAYASSRAEK